MIENARLREEIEYLKREIQKKEKGRGDLLERIKGHVSDNNDLTRQLKQQKAERFAQTPVAGSFSTSLKEINQLKHEINELKHKNRRLELNEGRILADLNQITEANRNHYLDQKKIEVAARSEVLKVERKLDVEKDELDREKESLVKRAEKLDREVAFHAASLFSEMSVRLREEIETIKTSLDKKKGALRLEWEKIKKERASLDERLNKGREKIEKARQSLNDREQRLKEKHPSQRELRRQIRVLKTDNEYLTDEISKAEKKLISQQKQMALNRQLRKERKELEQQFSRQAQDITRLERSVNTGKRTLERQKAEILRLTDDQSSVFSISSPKIFDWFVHGRSQMESVFPADLVTIGSGPLDADWFDEHLGDLGFQIWEPDDDCTHIIVGRENWESELDDAVSMCVMENPSIFSQELFIASYGLNEDPFELGDKELLLEFAKGHPALEYLRDGDFEWPDNFNQLSHSSEFLATPDWLETSPLTDAGYHVGVTGVSVRKRRTILSEVFHTEILTEDYGGIDWGAPQSRTRLRRMAYHLSRQIRFHKNLETAVQHWKADLRWLKENYFVERMRFKWPNI
jgi:hypothetical protein